MDKEFKSNLESLLQTVAKEFNLKIHSLDILTNQNPIIIKIIICKTNNDDINLDDCSRFNNPVTSVIENSNLLNCSYVLEIGSQGVSDESVSYTHLTLPTNREV